MSRLGRRIPPVVVTAIHVLDWRLRELRRVEIVKTGEVHRIISAADLLDVAVTERRDAAGLAEPVMAALGAELIVGQLAFAREQSKRLRLDDGAPVAPLGSCTCPCRRSSRGRLRSGLCRNGSFPCRSWSPCELLQRFSAASLRPRPTSAAPAMPSRARRTGERRSTVPIRAIASV